MVNDVNKLPVKFSSQQFLGQPSQLTIHILSIVQNPAEKSSLSKWFIVGSLSDLL